MNQKLIDFYMDTAIRMAQLSTAERLKVGAVIVKNDIMFPGYNGTPPGWNNKCEDELPYKDENGRYQLVTKPEVIHAELNAINKIIKSSESSQGSILFCTHLPCLDCSKVLYSAGVIEVYYREVYRCDRGKEFLEKCGIKIERI